MKGWEINAVKFAETGDPGNCPKCGSDDVDVKEFFFGKRYSISFRCRVCGSGDHLDGFREESDNRGDK